MGLNCAGNCLKYVIFCFNVACAGCGVILMIHGALSLLKIGEFSSYLQNPHLEDATVIPTIVICLGIFIFIISFIGSCGSLQEKRILLETYSICLLVLVLFQVILAVLIFLFLDDINKDSMRSFNKIWRSRGFSDNRMMIEMIQENLECCGSANMYDYNFEILPLSCCPKTMERCSFDEAYQLGCKAHLGESIHTSGITISYLCLVTAAFEFCAAVMGFVLSGHIRKVQEAKRRCC